MTATFDSTNMTFYKHMYEISLGDLQESSSAGWFLLVPSLSSALMPATSQR